MQPPPPHPPLPPPLLPTTIDKQTGGKEICIGSDAKLGEITGIFTCNGNVTLVQMFAPGGTPHSNGKNKVNEEGWPTWRGGGCQCIGSKFRCDLEAEVPLDDRNPAPGEVINNGRAGNATDFYNSLNGACSFQGLSMDINKSDTAFARWSSEINLQEHFTATIIGGIAKKYRRRDLIAKVDSAHEGCSPSAKLLR